MKRQELLTSPKKKVIIIRLHYIAFLRAHRKNGGIYKEEKVKNAHGEELSGYGYAKDVQSERF